MKKRRGSRPNRIDPDRGPRAVPDASLRYTPRTPSFRVRPRWHRLAGWLGIVFGIGIAVANDAMLLGDKLTLLPGGHTELYLILGLGIGAAATWFLGLFDRGTTVYD